jgi:membrane-associated protease RseP (regulator of RpoE activity)
MDTPQGPTPPRPWLNILLFALTVLSTGLVGLQLGWSYLHPDSPGSSLTPQAALSSIVEPRVLLLALLYSAVLMTILTGHELGHYLACRRYGLAATLPYFLPFPNLFGTLGAFIKIKTPIRSKRQLFDVGAAGPLAGTILAVPALIAGLAFSRIVPAGSAEGAVPLGEPLLLKLGSLVFFPHLPAGADILLHPVAFAGWVGLLVTSINLFPIGQLDGGHVAYALVGRRRKLVSSVALTAFLALGVFSFAGWLVWGIPGLLYGLIMRLKRPGRLYLMASRLQHPPVDDENHPLGRGRTILAVVIILVFILSFIPDPIKGTSLLTLLLRPGAGVK